MRKLRISDLCISTEPFSREVADELQRHCDYLNKVQDDTNTQVIISMRSGYRPVSWELSKGRSGSSVHTTFTVPNMGAVDIVANELIFKRIAEMDFYRRICLYPENNFMHVDRRIEGKGFYIASGSKKVWRIATYIEIMSFFNK